MMKHLLKPLLLLMACTYGLATPAYAQTTIDGRVTKIEKEVKALQRKVFPGGSEALLQPEITTPNAPVSAAGTPATSPIVDLTARMNALEAEVKNLTAQVEQNSFKISQMEETLARMKAVESSALPATVKPVTTPAGAAGTSAAPVAATATNPVTKPVAPALPTPAVGTTTEKPATALAGAAAVDEGEEAYLVGYKLWQDKRYAEAQKILDDVAKKYPTHRRASYARNLRGRAFLDNGQGSEAAKVFLANYRTDPKGERAPDSLYFLGQSLMSLKPPRSEEACKAYDELEDVYGVKMEAGLRTKMEAARKIAACTLS